MLHRVFEVPKLPSHLAHLDHFEMPSASTLQSKPKWSSVSSY